MKCPKCGNDNRDGARFCDSCGASLEAGPASAGGAATGGGGAAAIPAEVRPPPSDAPTEVGAGRYEVVGFLGEGTRKRVYLCRDSEREGALVAVAVFSTEGLAATAEARARREAEAMGALGDHARVVPVLSTGQDGSRPYIASEYMPGGDLRELLAGSREGRLEIARALRIATDVAEGLAHAHAQGIVHRDIKPANVWLDADGSARLGDFGLATSALRSREALETMVVGTAAYLPPEQAIGRRTDGRADLYSLGALLYEMLTGEPPFPGDDPVSIISRHLSAEPVAPSRHNAEVPGALDGLVAELLAKSPDDRPAGAAQLRAELERIAADPDGGEESEAEQNPLDALAGGVFVGREKELDSLRQLLETSLRERGTVALIEGEPGIGKTRLSEELITYARVRGATVLAASCHEAEATPAYWPFVQVLRSYIRDADPVGLAWQLGANGPELARLVPELTEIVPSISEPPEIESEESRFRFFEAVASFLLGASKSRPLLVVIDDLHWADSSSLELLRFLSHRLGRTPLLLLGAYRPEEAAGREELRRTLSELDQVPDRRRISLHGLDSEAISRYLELTTGRRPRPELVAEISEQTGGNPFFVGEVIRLLATEEGGELDELSVPHGVSEAIRRRVDRLDPGTREMLEAAAVLGREFDRDSLAVVLGDSPDAAIEQARAARILEPRSGGAFMFTHAVFREVLADGIADGDRVALHRKAAEAIESLFAGRLSGQLTALARHYGAVARGTAGEGAGDVQAKAREYSRAAGRQAAGRLAHADAAEHLGRALELLPEDARAEALDLRLELGEELTRGGGFVAAREVLFEAARLARELGDAEALTTAAIKIAALSQTGLREEEIAGVLREALAAVGEDELAKRGRLMAALAQEEYWEDPVEADRLSTEAIELARSSGDPAALAPALAIRQFVDTARPGRVPARLRNAEELREVSRQAGDRSNEARAHAYRMTALLQLGDVGSADRAMADYVQLAEQLAEPRHLWHIPVMRASRAIMAGRLTEAKLLAGEGQRLGQLAEEPLSEQFHVIQMALIRTFEGAAEEMLPVVREMVERYPAIPAWRLALVGFLTEADRLDEARADFEPIAARGFDGIPRDANWLVGVSRIGEVAARLGDERSCRDLLGRLADYSGEVVIVGRSAACQGPVDRYLGMMSAAIGEDERAIAYLESALELIERMADRPMRAEVRLQLGRVLLARGAEGDRDRALEILALALEEAQEIGMRRHVERAVRLRLEAQGVTTVGADASIDSVALAVADERPDLVSVASADGRVTILFSDIENSTLMTERLGDERWIEVLRGHNSIFRRRLQEHSGTEVKNQGDGFMLAFPDPAEALKCALAVQDDLEEAASDGRQDERVRVRMGMHVGEVIEEEGDFFGRSVILAARIAAQALGGEILVSEALRERGPASCRFEGERVLELKGLAGSHRVFRLGRAQAPVG